ncbi:DNA polymerase III subunit delta [Patescibacteria group bacterium]|nr:DNA polymerase III subunit delta [Patescibacteria group bacterium]
MTISNTKNINLYFGDDDFSMAEEMKKEKVLFGKSGDQMSVIEIDWQNQSLSQSEKMSKLQDALMGASLFSSDKLVIIKNSLFSGPKKRKDKSDKEDEKNVTDAGSEIILKYFQNKQEGIKIFFIEESLDKRKKVYKELVKLEKIGDAMMKEFIVPANAAFDNWIKKRIEKKSGRISREALNIFSITLGKGLAQKDKNGKMSQSYNLWETASEIEKLLSYCEGREIKKEDVSLLIKSKVDMSIFNLIDSMSSKNKSKATLLLNQQIEEGINENYILTMFVYQFRNLIRVKSLLNQGISSGEITSETKMHPYVVQKSIEQCQGFEIEHLKKIYQKLYDADLAIKSGKIKPRLALELLVVSVS